MGPCLEKLFTSSSAAHSAVELPLQMKHHRYLVAKRLCHMHGSGSSLQISLVGTSFASKQSWSEYTAWLTHEIEVSNSLLDVHHSTIRFDLHITGHSDFTTLRPTSHNTTIPYWVKPTDDTPKSKSMNHTSAPFRNSSRQVRTAAPSSSPASTASTDAFQASNPHHAPIRTASHTPTLAIENGTNGGNSGSQIGLRSGHYSPRFDGYLAGF